MIVLVEEVNMEIISLTTVIAAFLLVFHVLLPSNVSAVLLIIFLLELNACLSVDVLVAISCLVENVSPIVVVSGQ